MFFSREVICTKPFCGAICSLCFCHPSHSERKMSRINADAEGRTRGMDVGVDARAEAG